MTAALFCPLEKIGLETDSPYLPPMKNIDFGKWGPHVNEDGYRNSVPSNVYAIAAIIGSIKDINPINVLDAAKANFRKFFTEVIKIILKEYKYNINVLK